MSSDRYRLVLYGGRYSSSAEKGGEMKSKIKQFTKRVVFVLAALNTIFSFVTKLIHYLSK
jgi:hypothetical protein